jgi:predicted permease
MKFKEKILGSILRHSIREGALEDFNDQFQMIVKERSKLLAIIWYWFQILYFFPAYLFNYLYWGVIMFKNYLKTTIRNIIKYKGYSLINISGLAIGMACCLLISMWVLDELSYDKFHKNASQLYRVEENQHYSGRIFHVTVTPYPIAPAMVKEFPEIADATRYVWAGGSLLRYKEKAFYEYYMRAVDPSFLNMFTFPLIKGDITTALKESHSIIISEKIAEKYFGEEDPLGKTITINNKNVFTVTGILKDVPHNSYLQFDILIPYEFLRKTGRTNDSWGSNSIQTFVKLQPQATMDQTNKKILNYIRTREKESLTDLELMPFTRIHLHAYWGYEKKAGNIVGVYIFSVIAVFILVIACINFMNLATARSARRAREVGMRKVVGALKSNLIRQFFTESVVFALVALVLAVIIVMLLLPTFNNLTGKEITFGVAGFQNILMLLLAITLFTGIVAGSYPALYLSAFHPVKVLKGSLSRGGVLFRRILVVFQFVLSIFLILGIIVTSQQFTYLKNKDLGYDKDHLFYVGVREGIKNSYQTLKTEIKKIPNVLGVTGTQQVPGNIGSNSSNADWDGKDPEFDLLVGFNQIDYDFVKTMKIDIVSGREFTKDFPGDIKKNFLINEEMARIMRNKEPVGARFQFQGVKGQVVGVMKDFHYQYTGLKIEPLAWLLDPEDVNYLLVRVAPKDVSATIDTIKTTWSRVIPNYPFNYRFLDEDFDRMYRQAERMETVVGTFTLLSIFIACLGLFGLASFTAEQRTKEIGIRKVLGATIPKLTFLICREFLLLVVLATIIAWPLAYLTMNNFLKDFAYRISLSPSFFILSMAIAVVIAVISVAYQSIKAALTNPVDSLRYE